MAHNSLICLVLCHILGIPLAEYRRRFPWVRNCHLNQLRVQPGKQAELLHFNALLTEGWAPSEEVAEYAGS